MSIIASIKSLLGRTEESAVVLVPVPAPFFDFNRGILNGQCRFSDAEVEAMQVLSHDEKVGIYQRRLGEDENVTRLAQRAERKQVKAFFEMKRRGCARAPEPVVEAIAAGEADYYDSMAEQYEGYYAPGIV